jgi:mono/diheme cytochrome c family protein
MRAPARRARPIACRWFARIPLAGLVALVATAVVVAVASGGTSSESRTTLTTINVSIRDTGFVMPRKKAPLGQVKFVVKNMGARPHGFRIAGKKTPTLTRGKTATLSVKFTKAAKYPYASTVKADTARGFKGTFTVTAPPAAGTPGNAKLGKSLFIANCGTCHTMKAAGTRGTIGPNLDTTNLPFATIVKVVTNGKSGSAGTMPPFKGNLTTEQIQDVAAFVFDATH